MLLTPRISGLHNTHHRGAETQRQPFPLLSSAFSDASAVQGVFVHRQRIGLGSRYRACQSETKVGVSCRILELYNYNITFSAVPVIPNAAPTKPHV